MIFGDKVRDETDLGDSADALAHAQKRFRSTDDATDTYFGGLSGDVFRSGSVSLADPSGLTTSTPLLSADANGGASAANMSVWQLLSGSDSRTGPGQAAEGYSPTKAQPVGHSSPSTPLAVPHSLSRAPKVPTVGDSVHSGGASAGPGPGASEFEGGGGTGTVPLADTPKKMKPLEFVQVSNVLCVGICKPLKWHPHPQ